MAHEKHMGVPRSDKTPAAIAEMREQTIADGTATPLERNWFFTEFSNIYHATRQGADTYAHWRVIQGNSFLVAGYLEAVAAARREEV